MMSNTVKTEVQRHRVGKLLERIQENAQGCMAPCSKQIDEWISEIREILDIPFSMIYVQEEIGVEMDERI